VLRGYLDQLTAAPGTALPVRLSGDHRAPAVQVLRLRHSDPNPAGPGVLAEPQEWPVSQLSDVRSEQVRTGSAGLIPGCFAKPAGPVTFCAWVWPTRLEAAPVIAAWQAGDRAARLLLRDGRLALVADDEALVVAPHALHERQWYFVAVSLNEPAARVTIAWGQHGRTGGPYTVTSSLPPAVPVPSAGSAFVLGGTLADGQPAGWFDGKIAAPALLSSEPDPIALMDIMNWGVVAAVAERDILARWAFGPPGDLDAIIDLTGHGHSGTLVNAPGLGVTGPPPVGSDLTATRALRPPYQSVHFHRDDLADCRWPQTHELVVPAQADSGFYVLRATDEQGIADLPFVVRPSGRPPVLLLAPTFTWQAYANLGRDPGLYPGRSHYALHDDGSPVYVSTRLKPMPGLRPAARVEVDAVDSFIAADPADTAAAGEGLASAHLLMADLYASYWLDRTGADYGVITDADLHAGGWPVLDGCRTLVLSAHPEYWTGAMLDALGEFIDRGGSVLYLGGNGLYWVTSVHPAAPHLLEVRRWAGSQTSNADPGERLHAFEPQQGGTWSDSGRPPDQLVSVGFAGFGYGQAIGYQRTPASYQPEFAWVFDGTTEPVIGTEGLNQGGAVGFEFDRFDPALAPPGCTVLATAVPADGSFFRNYELGIGRAPDPETRCDLVVRRTPAGGLVFSLGSITASGCLPVRNGRNDLARICTNVLQATLRTG
jgi:N,N-dimethylformamidase beta subunit-like protein